MTIKNLLTEQEQSFTESSSLWVPYPSSATAISRSVFRFNSEPASLLMISKNGAQMVARLDREVPVSPGTRYRMFVSAYSEVADHPFGISASILSRSGAVITSVEAQTDTVFGRWNTASAYFVAPENASAVSVTVFAFPDHGTPAGDIIEHRSIWVDDVVLAEWPEGTSNEFLNLVRRHIPAYMIELDEDDPGTPLMRFIDGNTSIAEEILEAVKAFDYIPAVDGIPGYERSSLVDPSFYPDPVIAKREWLPWLAQLVGTRGVSAGSSGLTPWFWLEQQIGTWTGMETQIDPSANPVWSLVDFTLTRTSGTVTASLSSQTGGSDPYFPKVGDVVEVTAEDSSFNGSYSLTASDEIAQTVAWEQDGADAVDSSPSGAASIRISDSSWVEIESANPLAFDTIGVLADLTRTRATGLKSGSRYAIKAAARAVLDGFDDRATISYDGTDKLVVVTNSPHTLEAGGFIEIYDCRETPYNTQTTVVSVLSPTSFTIATPYGANNDPHYGESFPCWATNKKVLLDIITPWEWTFKTTEGQTYALTLLEQAVGKAKPAGAIVNHEYTT